MKSRNRSPPPAVPPNPPWVMCGSVQRPDVTAGLTQGAVQEAVFAIVVSVLQTAPWKTRQ